MKLDEFNELFTQFAETPLRQSGFLQHKNTGTLVRTAQSAQLALIRLGGRLSRPGCISHALCFRHTYLRPIKSNEPVAVSLAPSDYPYKLDLGEFQLGVPVDLRYRPMNSGRWPVDRIVFDVSQTDAVRNRLEELVNQLTTLVVPWMSSITPEVAANQIAAHGEEAWCERRWLEDYQKHSR